MADTHRGVAGETRGCYPCHARRNVQVVVLVIAVALAIALASAVHGKTAPPPSVDPPIPINIDCDRPDDPLVEMCQLNLAMYRASPPQYPMFRDQVRAFCVDSARTKIRMSELEAQMDAKGVPGWQEAAPAGIVFHMARCGMLASVSNTMVFSESTPPAMLLSHCTPNRDTAVRHLRTIVRAMGRPNNNQRVIFKMQSGTVPYNDLLRAAFPQTPFIFVFREPGQVMTSMLYSGNRGTPPCMRSQYDPPTMLSSMLSDINVVARAAKPAQYCAAHLGFLMRLGKDALESTQAPALAVNYNTMPQSIVETVAPLFGLQLSTEDRARMVDIGSVYSKSRSSTARTFEGDSERKTDIVEHQEGAKEALRQLATPHYEALLRLTTATPPQPVAPPPVSAPATPQATPGRVLPAPSTGVPELDAMLRSDPGVEQTDDTVGEYPAYFKLGDILDTWNPDLPHPPPQAAKHDSLVRLDYSNEEEREQAKRLRDAEVPFIVYNIPSLERTRRKWTNEYLTGALGTNKFNVEISEDNHQMFYHKSSLRGGKWSAPTRSDRMTFEEWMKNTQRSIKIDEPHYYFRVSSNNQGSGVSGFITQDLDYFRRGTDESKFFLVDPASQRGIHCRFGEQGIIAEDHYDGGRNFVSMIRGSKRYIISPPSQCKNLGILPYPHPSARHSAIDWSDRHKVSNRYAEIMNVADKHFDNAAAVSVVLRAGDAMYIPSFWFHYIVSLETNIQCNSRSGTPPVGGHWIQECGFDPHADGSVTDVWTGTRKRYQQDFATHNRDVSRNAAAAWAAKHPEQSTPVNPAAVAPPRQSTPVLRPKDGGGTSITNTPAPAPAPVASPPPPSRGAAPGVGPTTQRSIGVGARKSSSGPSDEGIGDPMWTATWALGGLVLCGGIVTIVAVKRRMRARGGGV